MAGGEGAAVVDGRLVRTSPSAIELFKERCETAWWLRYNQGAEEKIHASIKTAQGNGTAAHKELEDYLKDATPPVDVFAVALLPYAPPRGPDLIVEGRTDGLTAAGIPVTGRIDWAHGRIPTRPIVADWKTRKDLDKYQKTEAELRRDVQMGSYARWALLRFPGAELVDVSHLYVETKHHIGKYGVRIQNSNKPRTHNLLVNFSIDSTLELWSDIERSVEKMKSVAGVPKEKATSISHPEDMRASGAACQKFGGCGFKWCCPHSPMARLRSAALANLAVPVVEAKQEQAQVKTMSLSDLLAKAKDKLPVVTPAVENALKAAAATPVPPIEGITPPDMPTNTQPAATPAPAPAPTPAPAPKEEEPAKPAAAPATTNEAEHQHAFNLMGVCKCGKRKPGRPRKAPPIEAEATAEKEEAPAPQPAPASTPAPAPAPQPAPEFKEEKVYRAHDEAPAKPATKALTFAEENGLEPMVTTMVTPVVRPVASYDQRLYLNCTSTLPTVDLTSYVAMCANQVAKASSVDDLRWSGDKNSPLAYGGWKGVLAAYVRENPPADPRCSLFTKGDEIAEVVAATLASLFTETIRGY